MAKREPTPSTTATNAQKATSSAVPTTTMTPKNATSSSTSSLKVYHGFSRTVPQSANGYRIGAELNPHFRLKKIAESVHTFCKAKDMKALEVLISTPEVVILDAEFVEVLKLIAAEGKTRNSDRTKRHTIFAQLITTKTFSCSALRKHLAEKLTLDEMVELVRLCVGLLFSIAPQQKSGDIADGVNASLPKNAQIDGDNGSNADRGFGRALELCGALLDSYIHQCSLASSATSDESHQILNEQLALIEAMIKLCEQFTRLESIANTRRELPALMKPPFSDYHIEKFELESVAL